MVFEYFKNINFTQPIFFWLFLLIPFLIYWYAVKNSRMQSTLKVSTLKRTGLNSIKSSLKFIPFVLKLLCLTCIILALARPQTSNEKQSSEGEGIDIVLCLDVSGSMTARDFIPNRLEASKQVASDFVRRRPTDRIGVVIFSGESFTLCPITTDHGIVLSAINGIRNGLLEDGTAIGSGLSTSVDRLRSGTSKSKIILLLTDGINNGGLIDPRTAKEIAKTFGIKVYTIGVGSDGYAEMPVSTPSGVVMHNEKVNIDEKLMTEIAVETGGKYFRAKDNKELNKIYSEIDQLEKSKVEIVKTITHSDKYFPIVIFALIFLFLSVLLRYTLFNKFP